ncbi:ABC transporter permease [Bacillus sp. 2205SS5-2]|uniref:ABC transporter permease n=1 Tax=Bacillus sp. 2205SS5-2 TaxID=3109031 RepID=UPI003004BAA7
MLNLLRNEFMKIFKKPGTYVMLGLLVLLVGIMGAVLKYTEVDTAEDSNWEQRLTEENQYLQEVIANDENENMVTSQNKKNLAINTYRLENNIPPEQGSSVWTFVDNASGGIELVGLFAIIVAAGIVASEFSWGTIKLLLIRPISRLKILLSKYITVILFGLMLLVSLFVLSSVVGLVLFGGGNSVHLTYSGGEVIEESMIWYLAKSYLLGSIGVFLITTMAFMISTLFRNSSISIGISIFALLSGGVVTGILSFWFDWTKYIIFANTDLTMYAEGTPLVEGMTLGFSLAVLAVYYVIFMLLAFIPFVKRDVGA